MKVKDLIEILKKIDQDAEIVSKEYTGCNHSIHDVESIVFCEKGSRVQGWDDSSHSDNVDKKGKCLKNVVFIN